MNTKLHTPGPWGVFKDTEPMNEDGTICTSGNDFELRPLGCQKLGNEAADFQLMSEAPDMLEELKTCRKLFEDIGAVNHAIRIGALITLATHPMYRSKE